MGVAAVVFATLSVNYRTEHRQTWCLKGWSGLQQGLPQTEYSPSSVSRKARWWHVVFRVRSWLSSNKHTVSFNACISCSRRESARRHPDSLKMIHVWIAIATLTQEASSSLLSSFVLSTRQHSPIIAGFLARLWSGLNSESHLLRNFQARHFYLSSTGYVPIFFSRAQH